MKSERIKGIRKLARTLLFLLLCAALVLSMTYLFRPTPFGRYHIAGLRQEGPLDMVYIGGSSAFVYWQPLKAWNDCGYASYSYAASALPAESIRYCIREVRKTHEPELFVIDARAFQYWQEEATDAAMRTAADAMDVSMNRFAMVHDLLSKHSVAGKVGSGDGGLIDEWERRLPYYFDLMLYHTDYSALSSRENWAAIGNRLVAENKGWEWICKQADVPRPENFQTDRRAVLEENCEKTLLELLDYCADSDLNVLFVVCPYVLSEEDYAKYNTVRDTVEAYGFQFLNTNDACDAMGLDFSYDFYNDDHVNCFGAEKYTAYLERYIADTYHLPDHRGDPAYAGWDASFLRFSEEEAQAKETIRAIIESKKG